MCNPELKSPFRRTLHTIAHRALTEAAEKAMSIQRGEIQEISHQGAFESKAGHFYQPSYSPQRFKSAAERCRNRISSARLAAQLTVGIDDMQPSAVQKAADERRIPHSLGARSARLQDKLAQKDNQLQD